MSRVLVIDEITSQRIEALVESARRKPIPVDLVRENAAPPGTTVLALKDRKPGLVRPPSDTIEIPFGFRAAFSIEEQPAGLMGHLSISVDTPGKCPNESAVAMIAEAFGLPDPFDAVWLEEFDDGHYAVNLLKRMETRKEGHA
jgi:hypothetical protein